MEASAASKPLRQEISSPGPQRANRLENNNKQFAPVTWKSQRELPGIRKTDGQPENECIHFLVCPAVFCCALYAQRASEAGCPEVVDCVTQATAGSCSLLKLRNIRHWQGPGCNLHPGGVWGKAPSVTPSNFCFSAQYAAKKNANREARIGILFMCVFTPLSPNPRPWHCRAPAPWQRCPPGA